MGNQRPFQSSIVMVRAVWRRFALGLAVVGCATTLPGDRIAFHALARGPKTAGRAGPDAAAAAFDRHIAERFEAVRADHQDLDYPGLLERLKVARAPKARPGFDPTKADYYDKIRKALELTAEEQQIFGRTGMVGVDHVQRYSMAGAYLAIYQRDLPVLVTSDSILHAMHRSFDNILIEIETGLLIPDVKKLLAETQAALRLEAAAAASRALRRSVEDVDVYLTVARNLIQGSRIDPMCAMPDDEDAGQPSCVEAAVDPDGLSVHSDFGQDARITEVLGAIKAETATDAVALYGRSGAKIDWSQFKPRGHYTKSPALGRYFRTMMWLGRVDVGFHLAAPDAAFGRFDAARELRDAALLAWVVRRARQTERLAAMDRLIGFLVGMSDNTTVADVAAAADAAGIRAASDLDKRAALDALARGLAGKGQRIRSQLGARPPGGAPEVALPDVFQLFGQRFVLDSFITSKLVFDSILFQGNREERPMPSGLDVMAALGNDEAVGLAEPGLRKYHYSANLLAARTVVEERPASLWDGTQYDIWLSALAKLDDVPEGTDFPQVMRTQAWARKQLQTQLGSWSELRHDTILYAKQSYTMGILCEYPTGYVEPYPEFFARVALFAEQAAARVAPLEISQAAQIRTFLGQFATTVHKLEKLARKELAAQPFDGDEKKFLKETIRLEQHGGGGCGGPTITYSGWYPTLIYNGAPASWEPTIADVHTGPDGVLEVAVGDVDFLVAAIDNRGDRTAYVGPVYSYYEFESPTRLTDGEWRKRVAASEVPPRPEWVRAFQGKPVQRALPPPKH